MKKFVSILMGSDSDLDKVKSAAELFNQFEVPFEMHVYSAHRTPAETHTYVKQADERGAVAFICCAGMAAHLAGAVAALTIKPVIGVPIDAGPLSGLDALLSTVQMPAGVPVATVAIGKSGAKNAAYLAMQIMALSDESYANKLKQARIADKERILEKNQKLQDQLS